jgi:hypothetical protein
MAKIKQLGMAAGTFSVALGIGFVMQNGDALASRFGTDSTPDRPAPFAQTVETQDEEVSPLAAEPEIIVAATSLVEQPTIIEQPVAIEKTPPIEQFVTVEEPTIVEQPIIEQPIIVAQASIAAPKAPDMVASNPGVTSPAIGPVTTAPKQHEAPVQLITLEPEESPEIDLEAAAPVEVNCVPSMMAIASNAAMVDVSINAPCHTSTAFTIHHQGLKFTSMTDDAGTSVLAVPAVAEVAVLIAAFEDGDGAVATVWVPDFQNYDRAILQWQGDTSVMLSAYEGDARFGDDGHIHADNPGTLERLVAAEGGYLIQLGEITSVDPFMAEIYTFPKGAPNSSSEVMLVAEAEITAGNCGQELSAQSVRVSHTGATSALDLSMIMPECNAVGDFLILQNMFEDLTLASR